MQKKIPTYLHFEDFLVERYYDRTADEIRDEFFAIEEVALHIKPGETPFVIDPVYESAMFEDGAYHIYFRQEIPTPGYIKETVDA